MSLVTSGSTPFASIPITSMSKAELLSLNEQIVQRIRQLQTSEAISASCRLRIGQKASFYSRKHCRTVTIQIDKINTKTVHGTELDDFGKPKAWGGQWKVGTTLLTPL